MDPMMGQPMMNPMMNPYAAGMNGYLQNLNTELDYHSDGRTDFTGNRNTRTYIKDVSMGPSSSTSFGLLVNLDEDLSDDEDKNSIDFEVEDNSDDELDLEDLSFFSKMKKGAKSMGKGLKKFEKVAIKGREMGKKYYPQAEQALAIVAPKTHDKYVPKLEKGYKTFNDKANAYGGWNTVDKAANALQSVGLQ